MSDKSDNTPPLIPDEDAYADVVIAGHTYDGIKEYDNPMPGWWVWTFVATVVFGVFYWVGITFFDWVPTYEDDLVASRAELMEIRQAYAVANPPFVADAEGLALLIGDPAQIASGAELYATVCAACHGDQGQGLIGPNLTDAYAVHSMENTNVYSIIAAGLPEAGMPPWEAVFSAEEMGALVAYVQALRENPVEGKEPEGEPIAAVSDVASE
jgi:cytochrome c oxidase cbb3-type subunit 3